MNSHLHVVDLAIVLVALIASLAVGCFLSLGNKNSDSFFMAGRDMPGWAVGLSLLATIVSSMTFLALPAYSFKADWRWMATCLVYPLALIPAVIWFMPFFRKGHVDSAYEYLEQRFGVWARLYVASGFVLMQALRMGIILFATSLALEILLGLDSAIIITCMGVIVVVYCTLGGLKAVIWTDVIQAVALIAGGALVIPIVLSKITGGAELVLQEAVSAGKTSLGPTTLEPHVLSIWVILISHLIIYMQMSCTDQMFVQRYCAPRSLPAARRTLYIGMLATVPLWAYFIVMGTTLWAFYNHNPDPVVATLSPEEVFPHFITTQVPLGLSGAVAAALCLAAMSTLSSSINAAASVVKTDFYRRFLVIDASDRHDLVAGRFFSVLFGVTMIIIALVIRGTRTDTLIELQAVFLGVFGSGLLGIFLLAFATKTSNQAAAVATILTIVLVVAWLTLAQIETIQSWWPHELWLGVVANLFLFFFAIGWDALRRMIS
jgi:SSS family solute:Na+ symporter